MFSLIFMKLLVVHQLQCIQNAVAYFIGIFTYMCIKTCIKAVLKKWKIIFYRFHETQLRLKWYYDDVA